MRFLLLASVLSLALLSGCEPQQGQPGSITLGEGAELRSGGAVVRGPAKIEGGKDTGGTLTLKGTYTTCAVGGCDPATCSLTKPIGWSGDPSGTEGRASSGVIQAGDAAPLNADGSLTIRPSKNTIEFADTGPDTTTFSWRHADGEKCQRCARNMTGPYGKNTQTSVYKPGGDGAPVWSGCHACLVETLERAK